jgi:DNA adenine methylase
VEVFNDINERIYEFFRVISDPHLFEEFHRRISCTPIHRKFFEDAKDWASEKDMVGRVVKWFTLIRQSFSGDITYPSWSYCVDCSSRGMAATTSKWLKCIEYLPVFHERLMRVQFDCLHFRDVLRKYNGENWLTYCDPPYLKETRSRGGYMHDEMTEDDHRELLEILMQYKGSVVLSGYKNELYSILEENGWDRVDFEITTSSIGYTRTTDSTTNPDEWDRKRKRVESVWRNPLAMKKYKDAMLTGVIGERAPSTSELHKSGLSISNKRKKGPPVKPIF